jgi:hypothetical protein
MNARTPLSEARALLVRAKGEVTSPNRWTRGAYARDGRGRPTEPCAGKAVRLCASGALMVAEHEIHGTRITRRGRPGFYFETAEGDYVGPERFLIALEQLATALLRECIHEAAVRRVRQKSEWALGTPLNDLRWRVADFLNLLNDHSLIRHRNIVRAFEQAVMSLEELERRTHRGEERKPR